MTPEQQDLLHKATSSLEAAKVLLTSEFPEFAASRAYCAMFYVAEAFLEGEGLSFSKHSAVISAFGFVTDEVRRMITVGDISSSLATGATG